MNTKFLLAFAVLLLACLAGAVQGQTTANPNCPIQKTKAFMKNMMARVSPNKASTKVSPAANALARRKRQAEAAPSSASLVLIEPVAPATGGAAGPTVILEPIQPVEPQTLSPSTQEVIRYEQNIQREENRLTILLRTMMNNKYMPDREQVIQLTTTVLTLLLMMALGPSLGSNSGLVQSVVKQVVPFVVSYIVHYAADQASPGPLALDASAITSVQLQPVEVPKSALGQAS